MIVLLVLAGAVVEPLVKAQTLVDLRETGGSEDALEQAVETKTAEQVSNEIENTSEQKADTTDDLGKGF
jgi:hypothetical protein